LGITFRYTINGALHELDSKIFGKEELLWILLYADDIALLSDDPDKLRDMVTALDLAFRRWGLLTSVAKTKTLTVHVPMTGQGPVPVPESSLTANVLSMCNKLSTWDRLLPQTAKSKGKSAEGWH
jgi:hypothetical protein